MREEEMRLANAQDGYNGVQPVGSLLMLNDKWKRKEEEKKKAKCPG
jgi:hypothetical protein